MLGLGKVMSNKIRHLREEKIDTSQSFRKLVVATLYLSCFDRIKEFCNYRQNATSEGTTQRPSFSSVNHIVSWQGQSSGWHRDETILHGLAIGIQLGAVTAVVGPVRSGKSSFLNAILGNLICTSRMAEPVAEEEYERDETAYCSRTPLLENGIVRQHILGNPSSKRKRYDTVVSVCALEADLQALQKGHFTLVGSQVVKAGGGQKQCIALARAVYSRRKVVVLDDVFSGIDAVTARHVSNRLLGPNRLFKKQRTSVVVAPHRPPLSAPWRRRTVGSSSTGKFSEILARPVQTCTKLGSSVVAETETEASAGKSPLPALWPSAGAFRFSNVVASYNPDTDAVLRGVTLAVDASQHVAVAGRSGSGKTSLVLGLLQMMVLREGKLNWAGLAYRRWRWLSSAPGSTSFRRTLF
ncbi:P-loop containing nucleoside triphosphate hydrolase protein [Colletotrichum eremochloae]|nr:P-loop containing nucleoside triphosphate hydrolase protein [Colletotrichum eremochloae]